MSQLAILAAYSDSNPWMWMWMPMPSFKLCITVPSCLLAMLNINITVRIYLGPAPLTSSSCLYREVLTCDCHPISVLSVSLTKAQLQVKLLAAYAIIINN